MPLRQSARSQSADHAVTAMSFAPRGARGFSLVETLVVMTIVVIVVGIAVPSYKYVTNSNRVSAEVNQLLADMQYARSEAVKEGATVTVCPWDSTTNTSPTCLTSGATTWNKGWFVFSDLNGDGNFNTGDKVLRSQPSFSSSDTFVSSDTAVTFVSFNREGFTSIPATDNTTSGGLVFKLNVVSLNAQWERCLVISYAGIMQTLRNGQSLPGGKSPCT
jgi:type IV fimbrial biogenesis protein FimT